jgi:hypothetical protein
MSRYSRTRSRTVGSVVGKRVGRGEGRQGSNITRSSAEGETRMSRRLVLIPDLLSTPKNKEETAELVDKVGQNGQTITASTSQASMILPMLCVLMAACLWTCCCIQGHATTGIPNFDSSMLACLVDSLR